MTDSVKSVLHDATPSWNGYNYQGKVGLYVCLENILSEAKFGIELPAFDVFLDEHHIEYEWIEDFAIKKNDDYLSLHQVKHKAKNNFNDHVEAIATILYRKNGVLPDTDIFKYFKFTGLKAGEPTRIKEIIKREVIKSKLVDENWLLDSNWKVNVLSVDIKYRDNITKCLDDFEFLSQKAFSSSITYFHTAEKVSPPSEDISKIKGIPGYLVIGLTPPWSLSCTQIFLSFDNPPEYDLALSDDALNVELNRQINALLNLFHPETSFSEPEVKLYKTALCALIDQNIVTRHQHIRDKLDNNTPYLQRTKPSISFKAIVSELERNLRVQDKHYWNLICRENFETAYKDQLDELYQNIKSSTSDDDVTAYRQYIIRLEAVRINIIGQYFPNDCISFLRQIYPHIVLGPIEHQFYESISEPKKIQSVFLDFIQEVIEPSGKLSLNCRNMIFQYQPSCISFNENNQRRKEIEIEKVKKGIADNQPFILKNIDYIVVNSTDEHELIPVGIEKITEVKSYNNSPLTESDKYTSEKKVSFMDSRKALGEINE